MELNGTKSAIVTGGASGLGAAVARRLAAAFVQVSIFDTNADQGRVFAEQIGGRFHAVDVSDAASVAQGMAVVDRSFAQSAGAGKFDEVGLQCLQHLCARQAQHQGHLKQRQGESRHDDMRPTIDGHQTGVPKA